MTAHKVVTVERGTDAEGCPGFAARCEAPGCGAITFGGFSSRSAARDALAGHEEAPADQGEGNDQNTNTQEGETIMSNHTLSPIHPAIQEVFDDIANLEPGFVVVLGTDNAFYTPIEDVRVRRASELEHDDMEVGDTIWNVKVYDRAGEARELVDFPEGWWEQATAGVRLNTDMEHVAARLHGDFLLVGKGQCIVTGIHMVDGERAFEFTSASRFRESILEGKRRYLEARPEIVADRPNWADTSTVVEIHGDEATVSHSRAFGVVTIECYSMYENGVSNNCEEPVLLLPKEFHEDRAIPALMREVARDLVDAADALEPRGRAKNVAPEVTA